MLSRAARACVLASLLILTLYATRPGAYSIAAPPELALPPLSTPTLSPPPSTPTPVRPASATGAPAREAPTRLVIRAYFTEPHMIRDLAGWKEPWEVNYREGYLIVDVSPEELEIVVAAGFRIQVEEEMTQSLNQPRLRLPFQDGIPGFACYRTVEETFAAAEAIVASHPSLAAWLDIGDSWQKTEDPGTGYDMHVLRLSNQEVPGPKPDLFIMGGLHAREYATAEVVMRFAEMLVEQYGHDPDITWLLDYHEIHLLPQANPDGRKQAETGLFWRKNVNNNFCADSHSRGIDLNRNFSFQWGCCGGSSGFPCQETFRGPALASEPETQAIESYASTIFADQREDDLNAPAPPTSEGIFLDLHSYGELTLWPWGFTGQPAPNNAALRTLGRKLSYFNGYYPQQAIGLYPTDGAADDFAYGKLGVAAYTLEMGTGFFESCQTFEETVLPDNLQALLYAARVARSPYLIPAGPDALDLQISASHVARGDLLLLQGTIDDSRYSSANGIEPVDTIAGAEYYLDVPPWAGGTPIAMAPADGAFDEPREEVEAQVDSSLLADGRHTLFVQGRDSAGNQGAVSALFLWVGVSPTATPTSTVTIPPPATGALYLPLLTR